MKRHLLTLALLFAALPAFSPAQAQLQFDQQNNPPPALPTVQSLTPGVVWLQRTPASLFDLGMMELTAAANKTATSLFDVTGAVAEYQTEKGLLALSFYARTAYSELNCELVVKKLRDSMFPKRDDRKILADDLGSYFSSYGAAMPGRPASIGDELVAITRFAVFMPGGACQLPLFGSDDVNYWKDPNAPAPQLPAIATPAPAPAATPAPRTTPRSNSQPK